MPFGLGMGEMILIFLVVLLVFGAKRLPELGTSLGKGIREFKSSVREIETEIKTPSSIEEKSSASGSKSTDRNDDGAPRRLTTSQSD